MERTERRLKTLPGLIRNQNYTNIDTITDALDDFMYLYQSVLLLGQHNTLFRYARGLELKKNPNSPMRKFLPPQHTPEMIPDKYELLRQKSLEIIEKHINDEQK